MEQAAAQGMGNTINYVTDGEKTDYQYYVSGIRCDPQSAREAMALTSAAFKRKAASFYSMATNPLSRGRSPGTGP